MIRRNRLSIKSLGVFETPISPAKWFISCASRYESPLEGGVSCQEPGDHFGSSSCCFLWGGCGGYSRVNIGDGGTENEFGQVATVEPGDRVRVSLTDGNTIEGLVEKIDETGISLHALEDEGPIRTFLFKDIKLIERYVGSSGKHLGYFVGGFLVIVTISFAIWASNPEGFGSHNYFFPNDPAI